jgi:hypothetical protein
MVRDFMTKFNIPALFFSFLLLIFTASCAQLFETTEDVQARKALTDLMDHRRRSGKKGFDGSHGNPGSFSCRESTLRPQLH